MMRLVDRPHLMPAQTLYGTTTGPVVDTEAILINGGRVYLSDTEVWSAAALRPNVVEGIAAELGWASPAQVEELKAANDRLQEQLEQARSETTRVVTLEDVRELASDLLAKAQVAGEAA